ncbi:hypothetical protein G3O08_20365, partial [Cryomorpha ignava]|nr:hypothetical protein [Cryomorpha ignava]
NLLGLPATMADVEAINFDNAGAGNCLIWFLSFDADNSNADEAAASFLEGNDVNAGDLTGCFELSNSIEVVRENCGSEFDCPDLEANFGDACDDQDETTENDEIGNDCLCAGTPIPDVPENDLCADAIAVVCGETASGTTLGATANTSIPFCGTGLTSAPGVWYSLSDFSGIVSVTTCSEGGPAFDTKLGVFSGSCDALVCVGGDDDASSTETDLDCTIGTATVNRASFVEFEASADETYYIYVTGFSSAAGNFDLTVSCQVIDCVTPELALSAVDVDGIALEGCVEAGSDYYVMATLSGGSGNATYNVTANGGDAEVVDADGSFTFGPFTVGTSVSVNAVGADSDICEVSASIDSPAVCAPSNDSCADATAIACGQPIAGSTYGATLSGIASPSCAGGTPADVFYTFEAMPNVSYTITVNGDDYDGVLVIYSGSCDDLSEIDCSDSGFTSGIAETIDFTVDEATTITVRTYDWSSTRGSFTLSVSCEDVVVFDCPDLEANFGDACNDDNPDTENDMVNEDCICMGTPIVVEFDCPDLEANFGDACNDGNDDTQNDVIVEGCGCEGTPVVTPTCNDFVYYISDHAAADGISDIFEVTVSGGVATMEYIATSDIEIHIAYNSVDNLLYAVSKHTNSYRTLNPHVPAPSFGPTVALGADYGELTAAVFNADGKLLIGSQNNNAIYSVNVITDLVSPYDAYSPVTGGDLAFGSDGMLYLATRSGNGLYENYPSPAVDNLIGSVPVKVTGLAITDTDELLVSAQGQTSLQLYSTGGANIGSYPLELDGEAYTLRDGDMASGCNTFDQPNEGECLDYKLFYIHQAAGGGAEPLLEVTLNGDGTASYTTVMPNLGGHIGLSPDGSLIYNVSGNNNLKVVDVASATVIATLSIQTAGGMNISGFPTAVVGSDGTFYAGSSSTNQVYTINPGTGIATPYGPSRTVQGGDLIEVENEIWLITRNNNTFTNVLTGASFTVPVNEINGAAVLDNGNVLLADGNGGSLLKEVNLASMEVVATYDIALPLFNGDLAGGCILSGGLNTQCYGSEILDFNQGLQTNGSAVPANRSDATAALGEPDRSNAAGGFVSLGVGGSITLGFGGVIYDAPGNDILIWETSFSGDACGGSDDEQADIALSQDGINFVSVGSICRDGGVDIAGTGLDYVSAIRITNSASTGSLDGYDLDGVEAINGCSEEPAIENGDCYATEVVEYIQGLKSNGGAIDVNRTNPLEALGAPERSNATGDLVFVSLGYGGSLTLAFDGAIPNEAGDDIEIVETTWNRTSCDEYFEFADVYVSVNGDDYFFAKTVCRADGFVDISDAGAFDYVNFVRVVNNDTLSTTPDAFDVDGVVALHNCEDGDTPAQFAPASQSELTSFPNPTSGPSQV